MARDPNRELETIQSDMKNIIAEIQNISDDLKTNQGIGIEKCTQGLDSILRDYKNVLSKLKQIRLNCGNNGGGASSGGAGSSRRF